MAAAVGHIATSNPPKLELSSASNTPTFTVDGDSGNLSLGGSGQGADVFLRDTVGSNRLQLQGDPGAITFRKPNGSPTVSIDGGTATIAAGGVGENGEFVLKGGLDDIRIRLDAAGGAQTTERISLNGAQGEIIGGGNGTPGSLKVKGAAGEERIGLQGASGTAHFGGVGQNGVVSVLPASGAAAIVLSADTGRASLRKDGSSRPPR